MYSTRREFLKGSLGAAGLLSLGSAAVPALLAQAAAAADRRGDTILVVIQLAGGNDGLNTVVPYGDDHYHRARPTLHLTARQVHKIDDHLGFHPEMAAFQRLYQEGHLSVVQGVAYPNVNGNHSVAMQVWQTACLREGESETGWLGRAVDQLDRPEEPGIPGAFVGQIHRPFGLNARHAAVPTIHSIDECTLRAAGLPGLGLDTEAQASSPNPAEPNPLLAFVRGAAQKAYADSAKVEEVLRKTDGTGKYPPYALAQNLRMVAQLIRAELGIRIFFADLGGEGFGGFDNHANQAANHGAMLRQLADSIAALVDDLNRDRLLDRVLLMTFSEFGRTVAENGRRGTDHGAAAPMFLAGGRLKGGLIGPHPDLKATIGAGGLRHHTDFRRVYATALDRWLGIDSQPILGETFEPLDILQA
jgi:uncharacterized protein (DUF1501 family)